MKGFKILFAILIFAIMLSFILSKTTCAAEEKNYIQIQHLVFQMDETVIPKDKNAAIELNNKLFRSIQEKFDTLGIPKVRLLPFSEKNIFVISYIGENTPEEIINAIQPGVVDSLYYFNIFNILRNKSGSLIGRREKNKPVFLSE